MVDIVKRGGRRDPPPSPEAEFLDVVGTKVLKVFLLAIYRFYAQKPEVGIDTGKSVECPTPI
jgi:hypothetical protein